MHRLGSLCSGYGGLDIAVQSILDTELTWWSDIEPDVMQYHHPDTPNLGDIKTIDWPSAPPVDILTAGYPCQPFSNAGKRLGTEDPRHLWPWIASAIGILRPNLIILENVAAHLRRGFDVVSADLTALGYDVRWTIVRASDAGASHRRERLYVVAQDPDRPIGPEWWTATPGQAQGWWTRPDVGGRSLFSTSDPAGLGLESNQPSHDVSTSSGSGNEVAPDAQGVGRGEGWAESAGQFRRPDVADSGSSFDWREYAPAIERWERVTGRLAPLPTHLGQRGATVLSPRFVEWMMGLDDGLVTSVPGLSRAKQIQYLGNGVVPQQAILALCQLLEEPWDVSSSAPTPQT